MGNTLKFGNENWATKKDSILAYNDENSNFKPLPFTTSRAGTATRVNKSGLIETVASGIPRVDYLGNTRGFHLLEPQRTNLFTYSEDFENTVWVLNTGTTATNNYAISPDGKQTAGRFFGTLGSGLSGIFTLSVAEYTISFWVKSNNGVNQFCRLIGDSTNVSSDLPVTKEWTKISHTFTASGLVGKSNGIFSDSSSNDIDILVWGAQLEEGNSASSIITTNGSTVTRLAETTTGAGNTSTFNDSEGVLYLEGSALAEGTDRRISLSDNSLNNYVSIGYSRFTNHIIAEIMSGGVIQTANFGATGVNQTNNNKFALSWGAGIMKFYVNGTQKNTESITSPTGLIDLSFRSGSGTEPMFSKTIDLRVYNTELSNAELVTLTTI